MRLFYCESKNSVQKIKIFIIFFVVCCTSCCKMEKRLENIKASTVFQVQWFANSENYNAAASVISQGKRVFQQVNDSFRRDTVLADTIPMLRISHNARIKTKSLVGIGVNTFSIGGIGTRCTASTNARTRFRNRNAFGTYLFETKGVILTVAFSEELKFLSALRTARLGYIFKERNQFALFTLH